MTVLCNQLSGCALISGALGLCPRRAAWCCRTAVPLAALLCSIPRNERICPVEAARLAKFSAAPHAHQVRRQDFPPPWERGYAARTGQSLARVSLALAFHMPLVDWAHQTGMRTLSFARHADIDFYIFSLHKRLRIPRVRCENEGGL